MSGPAWPTVYRHFARWSWERVRAKLHRVVLDELGARGDLDWPRCAIDSVSVRAGVNGLNRPRFSGPNWPHRRGTRERSGVVPA